MTLTCDRTAKKHYRNELGTEYFSVSQIRQAMFNPYVGLPESVLEQARRRGVLLHARFWKMLGARAGLCAFPPILEEYAGQCRAMDEWAERNAVEPIRLEEASVCQRYGFAGTPDAQVRYGTRGLVAIVDLKSGAKVPTDGAQILLYQQMEGYQRSKLLLDLYVTEDGYKEVQQKPDPHILAAALSALNLLKWRASL